MKEVTVELYGATTKDYRISFEDDVAEAVLAEFRRLFRNHRSVHNGELLNAFISLIIEKHAQQRETTETIKQKMSDFNEMFKTVKPRDKGATLFVANKQSGELVATDEASGISAGGAGGGGGGGASANSNLDGAAAENGGESGVDLAGAGAGENSSGANIDPDGTQTSQGAGALATDIPVSQGALDAAASSALRPSYAYYKSKFYDKNGQPLKREIKVNDEISRGKNQTQNADGESGGESGGANSNLTPNTQEIAASAADGAQTADVKVAAAAEVAAVVEVPAAETPAQAVATAEIPTEKTPAQPKEKPAQKPEQKFAGFGRFRRQK